MTAKVLMFKHNLFEDSSILPLMKENVKQLRELCLRYDWHKKGLSYDTMVRLELLDLLTWLSNQPKDHSTFSSILDSFALKNEIDIAWELLEVKTNTNY